MLIPYNTDAPVYHFPFATLGLIATNVVCFAVTGGGDRAFDSWILEYGNGFHPLQWISSLFFHLGVVHLLGNMLFLWVFGLVVEGKVGWRRFLVLYFGMGVLQSVVQQAIMLGAGDRAAGSAGASGVLFALMAMSMVWAPRNDIQCAFFVFPIFRVGVGYFDISIQTMAVLYLAMQILFAVFLQFSMSSEVIHLIGAAIGFGVAVVMLRHNLVDCENWDLLSIWRGDHRDTGSLDEYHHVEVEAARQRLSESGAFSYSPKAKQQALRIEQLIARSKFGGALRELRQLKHLLPDYQLGEEALGELARGLYRQQRWDQVSPLLEEYIARFPHNASSMRLRQAAILLEVRQRPRAALRCAAEIDPSALKPRQAEEMKKIRRAAQKLVDSGHLEPGE